MTSGEMLWVVYKRRKLRTLWNLVFVLPASAKEDEIERCIRLYEDVTDHGYKMWFLLIRQYPHEVRETLRDEREHAPYIP